MGRVSRRRFLTQAAVALGATPILVATGCAAPASPTPTTAKPAAGSTPASAKPTEPAKPTPAAEAKPQPTPNLKGTTLAILEGTYFVAAAQELFKKQAADWGKANGVDVSTDFMNWPDLQAKIAAAIASGSGADVVELWPVWNFLYKDSLFDVGDVAGEVEKAGGGWAPYVVNSSRVDGKYVSVPHGSTNSGMNFRVSWLKEVGVDVPAKGGPDMTWEEFFAAAKKLKAKGHPVGQALGHSLGDPPSFCYPYMWSYGAMEVEKDGKTVAFNKPEFVDAMKRFVQAWKDGYDETALSGDDSYNNRAFLAEQISATLNGSSIYVAAKKDKPAMVGDIDHMLMPKGPAGRFYQLGVKSIGILKRSKNTAGGKEFLKWWFDDKQFGEWFRIQEGYQLPNTKKWSEDPMWDKDPKIWAFKEQPKYGREQGWAGLPGEKSSLAWSKFLVVDTYAKAVQTGDAAAAIKWGADELQKIYGG